MPRPRAPGAAAKEAAGACDAGEGDTVEVPLEGDAEMQGGTEIPIRADEGLELICLDAMLDVAAAVVENLFPTVILPTQREQDCATDAIFEDFTERGRDRGTGGRGAGGD